MSFAAAARSSSGRLMRRLKSTPPPTANTKIAAPAVSRRRRTSSTNCCVGRQFWSSTRRPEAPPALPADNGKTPMMYRPSPTCWIASSVPSRDNQSPVERSPSSAMRSAPVRLLAESRRPATMFTSERVTAASRRATASSRASPTVSVPRVSSANCAGSDTIRNRRLSRSTMARCERPAVASLMLARTASEGSTPAGQPGWLVQ